MLMEKKFNACKGRERGKVNKIEQKERERGTKRETLRKKDYDRKTLRRERGGKNIQKERKKEIYLRE